MSDRLNEAVEERLTRRAVEVLSRAGAYLEPVGLAYAVRIGPDHRRRPLLQLDEVVFRALVREPGLKPRVEGGWLLAPRVIAPPVPPPGRPGMMQGERLVAEPDGRLTPRRANLGESPIAWLARRRDAAGNPWLGAAEVMAAERLREDMERAGTLGRLTMDWSGAPKSGGRNPRSLDPAERARSAKDRVRAALNAVGPELSPLLERICLMGSALAATERDLGLPRRTGKTQLKAALARLARHYGLG